ncbi:MULTISPECIES: mechanosensitive ion channel family protein [unclassified Lentimonas]|uniref:mechanosensitive ion channel family protein n=1 Tax=unclassified Lentimonas TaxID=2630993 RepID=UPI00132A81B7|nr:MULTISPECIES: mechanosensitive ion channel domain-containing protein [unclassified Lentimonas]CAA6677420.1 Small-conductance mechanosensitive channel [Lentimonas sp. CC4]CAA6686390.1 Small-conductance mechanosensitive channel [Lentimonas sp. CC6]CAA6690158.1 Small-conductance mechanosensitive channel [Lentimonas sp. CC19]CAA6690886.1 Small-conductance mechanosensitive channel [Lentimonas sp. CC10]CAA7068452.1 Small-conductance mechanosensitive channel [Lentimonas sp. CC11]
MPTPTTDPSAINFEAIIQSCIEVVSTYGLQILAALAIFIIGRIVANLLTKALRTTMEKRKVEPSLIGFAASLTHAGLLVFVVLAALGKLGVQTTSFVAVIGAAGLAIGLALQGSLSNFAAGVLILIFKPYKVGDYVAAGGGEGVIHEIGIFTTTLITLDNKTQILPNAIATGGMIDNFSKQGTRRLDLVAGVSYSEDIRHVKKVLQEILDNEPRILPEPKPTIGLMEMGDSSINFAFRPWVKVEDYWDLFFELQERIKIRFDEEKISIPFPQRDVHLFKAD